MLLRTLGSVDKPGPTDVGKGATFLDLEGDDAGASTI
jgi:hypothetical protein